MAILVLATQVFVDLGSVLEVVTVSELLESPILWLSLSQLFLKRASPDAIIAVSSVSPTTLEIDVTIVGIQGPP